MDGKKVQNFLLGGIIVLVVLLIAAKFLYNQISKRNVWKPEDRTELVEDCMSLLIQDGHAVRFPSASEEYCQCQADSIMDKLSKTRYVEIMGLPKDEQFKQMIQVIAPCYNRYQTAMFEQSHLD